MTQSGIQHCLSILLSVLTYSVSQLPPKTGFPHGHQMKLHAPLLTSFKENMSLPTNLIELTWVIFLPKNNNMHCLVVCQEFGALIQSLASSYKNQLVKPEGTFLNLGDRTSFH